METTAEKQQTVVLPSRKVHKTPRLLMSDAYTVGSNDFESAEAREKSSYYGVFRRDLFKINQALYDKGDNRILLAGLQRLLDELFYEPVTHEEIDITKEFLENFKITTKGLKPYGFPEQIWRDVVDHFNGRPPIEIFAMPEGSVVYPGEPFYQCTSMVEGWGILAAWFEEKLLHVWATSESLTQSMHWHKKLVKLILEVNPHLSPSQASFTASTLLHDFGARAAICEAETETLGPSKLIVFPGTDSMSGAFQAWMNSGKKPGVAMSVKALAHRNVQAYKKHWECYEAIYNDAEDGDIVSEVADCYDYKYDVEHYLLPLALRSVKEGTGKVVTARPDSGVALDEVLWTLELAVKNGLYREIDINGKKWKGGTFLRFIEGDGMTFEMMWKILTAMIDAGFIPWEWGLFGQGGGQRNGLARDNFGAKYALNAVGKDNRGVVKLSDTIGKTTLPGPAKVLRTKEALEAKKTVVHHSEPGENAMVLFFNGFNKQKPFGPGQDDDFNVIKERAHYQFNTMPLNLDTTHGAPASDMLLEMRRALVKEYAPAKDGKY